MLTAAPRAVAPRAPAPSAAPPEPPDGDVLVREVAPDQRLVLQLVDVGSGESVPGVRIGWTASRARVTPILVLPNSISDAKGNVEVPRAEVTRLIAVGGDWTFVPRAEADVLADGRLHVSRLLRLNVVVTAAPGLRRPLDMSAVQVVLDHVRAESSGHSGRVEPYSNPWMLQRGRQRDLQATPDAEDA